MSGPAVALRTGVGGLRRVAGPRASRGGGVVEGWFRAHAILVYFFLYLPILVVVIFAFNGTNRNVTDWQGFSLKWFQAALENTNVQKALGNSIFVGFINAILATTFGTMAALGSAARPAAHPGGVRGADLYQRDHPRDRDRPGHPDPVLRPPGRGQPDPGRPAARLRAAGPAPARLLVDHRRPCPLQPEPGVPPGPRPAHEHGPNPCRGELRPVRHPMGDLPADHVPAAAARDRGGLPAELHLQLRRLRDHARSSPGPARRRCRCTSSARPARA